MKTSTDVAEVLKSYRNSLLRIAKCCEIPQTVTDSSALWEIEDAILSRLDQGKLEKKRGMATIKKQQKELDMLRQTSIFDFLKIHYEEIINKEEL